MHLRRFSKKWCNESSFLFTVFDNFCYFQELFTILFLKKSGNLINSMENLQCEKLSIRESARSLKKYGSTSRHVTKNQNFVKHIISSTDTLQGIALKYGVTTEQIRRANRLWATDSLFLREYLMIPVSEPIESASQDETDSDATSSFSAVTTPVSGDEDPFSFLVKIDTSIANTKEEVKKVQGNSEFASNFDEVFSNDRRKPAASRKKQLVNNNSFSDPMAPSDTVVMQGGRHLRSSLQRLQQEQDEIFEL